MWYLTFYCNPRIQTAVVGKILMDGIGAAVDGYANYIEKYIYTEELVEVPPPDHFVEEPAGCLGYDVRSRFKVFFLQFAYFFLIPFIGFREILYVLYDVYYRDRYGKIKSFHFH